MYRRHPSRLAFVVAAAVGLSLMPAPALAHNELRSSTPVDGARLTAPPTEVVLEFGERLDATFTTIAVTSADRTPIGLGRPGVKGSRAVQALMSPVADGTYTVAFHVVSLDGHPVRGSVSFTVSGATGQERVDVPSQVSRSPETQPTDRSGANAAPAPSGLGSPLWLAAGGIGLALAAFLTLRVRRSRRSNSTS